MPIRFRCPFCDQLLGISRRKVGTVIECPNCHGQVGVPGDDPVPEAASLPGAPPPEPLLFGAPAPAFGAPLPALAPPAPPTIAPTADYVLSTTTAALLVIGAVTLLGVAFLVGLLIGSKL